MRGEADVSDLNDLLGEEQAEELARSQHQPMYVAGQLSHLLKHAVETNELDRFAFLRAEEERATLIDHIGACERILRTPLAAACSIKIRRFLFLYLVVLPLAIVDKAGAMTPLITLLVAYSLLSLDQIGIELQNPFSLNRLSHLPLDELSRNIEKNVLSFAAAQTDERYEPRDETPRRQRAPQHLTAWQQSLLETANPVPQE